MSDLKKILVTGSNGQLGKELQRICNTMPGYEFIFLSKSDMPVNQFEMVRHIFNTLKPAYCINCAAYTAVDKAEEEKDLAFEINGEAVGVLAAVCLEHETKFIHISTDYVFDGKGDKPYLESDETSPVNAYGASKLKGEEEAFKCNPDSLIIRTSWVYSEFGKNFVKTMLRLMADKNSISVVNDQVGSPTYAADLADAILQIILYPEWKPGIYHFSNEGVITWFDFANAIKDIARTNTAIHPISTAEFPTPAKRPAYSFFNKQKIQDAFGINLKDWKASLASCIQRIENAPK